MEPLGPTAFLGVSRGTGALAGLVGAVVLVGWLLDAPALKSVAAGFVTMKPNTAVCFVLLGAALLLPRGPAVPPALGWLRRACGTLVAVLGLLTLAQYASGSNLGLDEFLFRDAPDAVRTSHPGRMAPVTAVNFLLLGVSVSFLGQAGRHGLCYALGLPAVVLATLALVGYAYDVESLQGIAPYTAMAVHTAATFAVVGGGLLCAWPDHGVVALYRQRTSGGLLLRRWLPAAVLLPVLLGWLRLRGEVAGLYDSRFGLALFVVLLVVALAAMVSWTTASLDRLDAERARAEEERDRFFTQSVDLLCVAGTDGYFKRLNPAWERTLGVPVADLMARPFLEFVHPEDREATAAEAARLGSGLDSVYFENRYRRGDGGYRWLAWTVRAPGPGESLLYATARDVTERKHAEEEVRRLNRALARRVAEAAAANEDLEAFSYSVSHDLRAPLRAIEGFSRILLEDCAAQMDAEGKRCLGVVVQNTRQMGRLIDDLLAFSRMGRKPLEVSTVDLEDLARAVFEEARHLERDRPVELRVGRLPPASGDPAMLRQVLANLLSNALKYTRGRTPAVVEVGASDGPAETAYFVRDNGVGFEMQYAHKLFGVFQRLHPQEEFEGTGVGLALVQRIVHRHGGRVRAEGAVGEGATFHFTLPKEGGTGGQPGRNRDPAR